MRKRETKVAQLSGAAKLGALITMAIVKPEMTAVAGRVTKRTLVHA